MLIAMMGDLSNHCARDGRAVRVGNWAYVDRYGERIECATFCPFTVADDAVKVRDIYHYGELMATISVRILYPKGNLSSVDFLNVGRGSASDQNGMNKIFVRAGHMIHYRRDAKGGGARYVNSLSGETMEF